MAQKTGDKLFSDMDLFDEMQWVGFKLSTLETLSEKGGEEVAQKVKEMSAKWMDKIEASGIVLKFAVNATKKRKL